MNLKSTEVGGIQERSNEISTNSNFDIGEQRVLIFLLPYQFPSTSANICSQHDRLKLKQMGRLPSSHSFLGVGSIPGRNPVPSSHSRFRPLVRLANLEVFVLGRMSDG